MQFLNVNYCATYSNHTCYRVKVSILCKLAILTEVHGIFPRTSTVMLESASNYSMTMPCHIPSRSIFISAVNITWD